jgi:putative ABC transport system ATP-binding protein
MRLFRVTATLVERMAEEPAAGAAVELAGVAKRYSTARQTVNALDDVSLAIEAGALVAVAGPSGSGKSTLLHVLGAMDVPDEGTVHVGGRELTALSRAERVAYRRRIGFVFQRFHLLPALTALDNVAAPLLPYRLGFDKHERAREMLAAVGLAGRENALPSELSGGQQQRVAIARALVGDPILLLADEPTGNLDSRTGEELLELLLRLRAERGTTVVVATHDPVVATRCDRIVRLYDGRVVDVTDVRPGETGELLGRLTRLDG